MPPKKHKAETKKRNAKLFNFVLPQAESYEGEEGSFPYTVSEDSIINRGMVDVCDTDSEDEICKNIVNTSKQLPLLTENDFDFVKVNRKTVHSYNLAEGMEYNYDVLKKLVGQGTLYIRMKSEYKFIYEDATEHAMEIEREMNESRYIGSEQNSPKVERTLDNAASTNIEIEASDE